VKSERSYSDVKKYIILGIVSTIPKPCNYFTPVELGIITESQVMSNTVNLTI